jgi:hypothetical protein
MFVIDLCFGYYTIAVSERRAVAASYWSSCECLANIAIIGLAVDDPWTIPYALAGAWIGTYISVRTTKEEK